MMHNINEQGVKSTGVLSRVRYYLEEAAIKIFVDSKMLHRWNFCHSMPSRSFYVRGRQFHICARCTGILIGYALTPLALIIFSSDMNAIIFAVFFVAMFVDGATQMARLRESKNAIRFITGVGFGTFFIGGVIWISIMLKNLLKTL